jgi:putative holliday junction resolvase
VILATNRVIGVDVGHKRTGIAIASTIAKLAEPYGVVDTADALKTLKQLVDESEVQAIVIGLPRNLEGDDTAQTRWVRQWVEQVKPRLRPPLFWQDEALTTSVASQRQVKSSQLDAEAASIILQDWLDSEEDARVNC